MKKILFALATALISVGLQAKEITDDYIFKTIFTEQAPNGVTDIKVEFQEKNTTDPNPVEQFNAYNLRFNFNNQEYECIIARRDVGAEKFFGEDKQFVYATTNPCKNSKQEPFKFKNNTDEGKLVRLFSDNGNESRALTNAEWTRYVNRGVLATEKPIASGGSVNKKNLASGGGSDDDSTDPPENNPKKSNSILKNNTVTHIGALLGGAAIGYGVTKLLEKKPKPVPAASSDITSSDSTAPAADETEPAAEPIMADENQD